MIRPERDAGRGSGRRATPAPTSPDREAAGRLYDRIYVVVAAIPAGRVATYGQVAALAGIPGHARQVGYALHALPESSELPWQRVINARGEVSARSGLDWVAGYQRHLLEEEGVVFDDRGRIDLARFLPSSALYCRPLPSHKLHRRRPESEFLCYNGNSPEPL